MFGIRIDRNLELSLTRQICDQLRNLIEDNVLKSGERLASTRQMAEELRISRNIMIEVYEQLTAEGYLESKVGSGTYVADHIIHVGYIKKNKRKKNALRERILQDRDKINDDMIYFEGGIPDLKLFPRKLWSKYLKLAVENSQSDIFNYGDIMGDYTLKKVLSDYIFRVKGIQCHPDQIIIVSGSSEGFMLLARAFKNKYKEIHVEDPTVNFIKNIFNNQNYQIKPIRVDQNGMKIEKLEGYCHPNLILLTPSHQFPTGSILTIQRRQRAIKIAEKTGSYIIEDDYDSEFRLKGIPIPPLQVLNPERVIYVSTFSKNMFPGLRLGFLVIPVDLINIIHTVKTRLNIRTSTINQRTLANFIKDRHLDRQIYRMKKEYKKRRALITSLLNKKFADDIILNGDKTGMHLQVEFHPDKHSQINWKHSEKYGVKVDTFEDYSLIKGKNSNKIVLGYGNLNSEQINTGIERLHRFLGESNF